MLLLLAVTQAYAEVYNKKQSDYTQIINIIKNILSFIGICFVLYAFYKTVIDYKEIFSIHSIKELLLPLVLTTLYIPFLYLLALYINYEELFVRIGFNTDDKNSKRKLKKEIFRVAKFNLNKLDKLSNNLIRYKLYQTDDIREYIKSITK